MTTRWERRAVLARLVGLVVLVVPVLTAAAVCWAVGLLWVSRDWPGPTAVRAVVLAVVGATVGYGASLASRRLLPLMMLLRLSLAFPDRAPSRAQIALRANRARKLQRIVERGEALPADTPQQLATLLVSLVGWMTIHDRRTRGHGERVCAITGLLADELGITGEQRDQLAWAALLHDVGKIGVSSALLNKPGPLSERERLQVQRHTLIGHELTSKLADWLGPYRSVPLEHHEWFDGSGYPYAKAAEEISFGARVVAVADVLDVMTSARTYHRARSWDDARAELVRMQSRQFDPTVVAAALRCGLARHRAGSLAGGAVSGGLGALVRSAPSAVMSIPAGMAAVGVAGVVGAAAATTVPAIQPAPEPAASEVQRVVQNGVATTLPVPSTLAVEGTSAGGPDGGSRTTMSSAGPAVGERVGGASTSTPISRTPATRPGPSADDASDATIPPAGEATSSTAAASEAPLLTVTVPALISLPESLPIVGPLQTVIVTLTVPPVLAPLTTLVALPTIPPALTTLPLVISTASSVVHSVTSVVPVQSAVRVVDDAVEQLSGLLPAIAPSTSTATTTTSVATPPRTPAGDRRATAVSLPAVSVPGL